MKHIKIIFLFFQYFHLIFSYYGTIYFYSDCVKIDNIYIDNIPKFNEYRNFFEGDFSSGNVISVKFYVNSLNNNNACYYKI